MTRPRCLWCWSGMLGLAILAGSMLFGCGGNNLETPAFVPEDAPAVKAKDSMDYARDQMNKSKNVRR